MKKRTKYKGSSSPKHTKQKNKEQKTNQKPTKIERKGAR